MLDAMIRMKPPRGFHRAGGAGHETFVAHDGVAAVEAAARLDPDAILLDIGLPVLNGYEAIVEFVNSKARSAGRCWWP